MAAVILRMIMDTEAFSNGMVRAMLMPISLKKVYYEYRINFLNESMFREACEKFKIKPSVVF